MTNVSSVGLKFSDRKRETGKTAAERRRHRSQGFHEAKKPWARPLLGYAHPTLNYSIHTYNILDYYVLIYTRDLASEFCS